MAANGDAKHKSDAVKSTATATATATTTAGAAAAAATTKPSAKQSTDAKQSTSAADASIRKCYDRTIRKMFPSTSVTTVASAAEASGDAAAEAKVDAVMAYALKFLSTCKPSHLQSKDVSYYYSTEWKTPTFEQAEYMYLRVAELYPQPMQLVTSHPDVLPFVPLVVKDLSSKTSTLKVLDNGYQRLRHLLDGYHFECIKNSYEQLGEEDNEMCWALYAESNKRQNRTLCKSMS